MIYCIIPNLYARNISKTVHKTLNLSQGKNVALTFDDGPDARYTLNLLSVLEKYNAKATFFVAARNADSNREIINKIILDGHEVALHTYKHKGMWQMFPWETSKEFEVGLRILEKIGVKVHYYRPPWGTFNLLTLRLCKKHNLKTVLWSKQANDWEKNNSIDNISNILIEKVSKNDIVLLHDCGGADNSPLKTIGALEKCLPILIDKGYKFVKISEDVL
jgi:peptidoglycan/xylan/chitin deacetylase (PgdA/CDA1 family)